MSQVLAAAWKRLPEVWKAMDRVQPQIEGLPLDNLQRARLERDMMALVEFMAATMIGDGMAVARTWVKAERILREGAPGDGQAAATH